MYWFILNIDWKMVVLVVTSNNSLHIEVYTYIPIYIQQDATLHSFFYLETALHVSGGTTTHHQERKQLYLQHLVFITPLLQPAAIVEELELKNILIYIQQDATLHSLFYLETALHVSGVTSTHHQESKQLYLHHPVFVTPLLLSASIVEELERQFQILHDSSR